MKNIIDDRADIVNLNNEELYLAGRLYNLEPFAMEQFNNGEYYVYSANSNPCTNKLIMQPPTKTLDTTKL